MKDTSESISSHDRRLRWWYLLPVLVLVLIALSVFFELAGDVWLNEGFTWDPSLMSILGQWRSPAATLFMWGITSTAGVFIILPALTYIIWFTSRRESAQAIMLAVGLAISASFNTWLKTFFARPRPDVIPPLTVEHTSSFPSGHTLSAVVFYGFLALEAWRRGHRGAAVLLAIWALLVGLSRIYLGVHYPSDVLASLALGLIFIMLMRSFLGLSYRFHKFAA